jgi:hypothetical protein
VVRVDGSGRMTLRNRKFLRKYVPVYEPQVRRSILEDFPMNPTRSGTQSNDMPLPDTMDTHEEKALTQLPAPTPPNDREPLVAQPEVTQMPVQPQNVDTPLTPISSPDRSSPQTSVPAAPKPPIAQQSLEPVRRSERKKQSPQWMKDYVSI